MTTYSGLAGPGSNFLSDFPCKFCYLWVISWRWGLGFGLLLHHIGSDGINDDCGYFVDGNLLSSAGNIVFVKACLRIIPT